METRAQLSLSGVDSPYAWVRLAAAVGLGTLGGVGMWSSSVVLPAVQAEFGGRARRGVAALHADHGRLRRSAASLMGRLADRFGIVRPSLLGIVMLAVGLRLPRRWRPACGSSRWPTAC